MPSSTVDWADIMATVRAQYAAPAPEDEVEAFTVIQPATNIQVTDLGPSPKGVSARATALGWTLTVRRSTTYHEPVLMLSDGKQGQKGDVRTPAHERRHYFLTAVDPTRKVGFHATWSGKGEGKSASFIDAIVVDPLGLPVELFFDYSKSPEPLASDADSLYNDGISHLNRRHLFTTAADFASWLADWEEMAGIEVTRKAPRKPKEKIVDQGIELLGGDWIG